MRGETRDGLPVPQRYWAIFTVGLAVTMATLDGAIANIALPTIARDLHASPASSIWVVNAYQLAVTVSLLPLASLGEIFQFRRVYRIGLLVFTLASFACSVTDSLVTLTLARILQGFGAAGIMSVNVALVRFIYPRSMLGRGIGLNAFIVAVSAALGPTVAAGILAVASWQWLFAINVPIGILALLATWALPHTRPAQHSFDTPSAILSALAFGLLITGIDGIGHSEGVIAVGLELAAAGVAGYVLVWRQLSQAWPLLPVDLMRIPLFAMSISTSICSFTAQMMAFVTLPFFLQDHLGLSQVATGLLMTPWPLTTAVVAPISGRMADRYSAGLLGGIGLAIFALGLGLLAYLPAHPGTVDLIWRMAVCGLGFGIFQSPNNRAIIASAPPDRSGGASGMLGTARLLGQTTGAALVALFFGLFPVSGTIVTLAVSAAVSAAAAGVSCLRLLDVARPPDQETAAPDPPPRQPRHEPPAPAPAGVGDEQAAAERIERPP